MIPGRRWSLLTLDLDDTLWPCGAVIAAAEQALYDWLACHAPRLAAAHSIESMRSHRLALARRRPESAHDLTRLRQEALRALLDEHGHDAALAEPATAVFRAARNRVEPYAEVPSVLLQLRARYTLVSVTNGNAQVEHTPLRGLFHLSLTAAGVGAAKPDPALFEAALAFAGAARPAALHIGDDPYLDVAAARAAGFSTVWVNRGQAQWPAGLARPDAEISDLNGLLDLLGSG